MKYFILLLLFLPSVAVAGNYGNATAKYVSVYDGDTVFVDICNWPEIIGKRIGIRVNGIDTPERFDKNPKVKELAAEARMFVVQTLKDAKKIELRDMDRGKYFRIAADIYVDDENLGDMLVDRKLAKRYDGKSKRPSWTEKDYNLFLEEKRRREIPRVPPILPPGTIRVNY